MSQCGFLWKHLLCFTSIARYAGEKTEILKVMSCHCLEKDRKTFVFGAIVHVHFVLSSARSIQQGERASRQSSQCLSDDWLAWLLSILICQLSAAYLELMLDTGNRTLVYCRGTYVWLFPVEHQQQLISQASPSRSFRPCAGSINPTILLLLGSMRVFLKWKWIKCVTCLYTSSIHFHYSLWPCIWCINGLAYV